MPDPTNWLPVFKRFISHLRIVSREVSTQVGEEGIKLDLWDSQTRFLTAVAGGLDRGIHDFKFLKSRQLGVTTISLAVDIFWLAIHPNIFGALAIDTETNRDIFRETLRRYVTGMAEYLGSNFTISKGGDNRSYMRFSNGSRMDFLVAGRSKTNWGESRGYTLAHLTEVAKYGKASGLASFQESLSQSNPDRLFIYESTANGMNHWKDLWEASKLDPLTTICTFIGWWAKPQNSVAQRDPRYKVYGKAGPSPDEKELIAEVAERYGHKITREQLAWFRWRTATATNTDDLDQNQPWTEDQAFVLTGFSFFQVRKIVEEMQLAKEEQWLGYRFYLGNVFFSSRMEQITDQNRLSEVELRVWEPPVAEGRYAIGCDPAFGRNDNADNHAISVWRCFADKAVQVAEWATNKHETRQAAWVLAALAGAYRNCLLNVEITGGAGLAVMDELKHIRQMLREDTWDKGTAQPDWTSFLENARWYLYHRPDSMGAGFAFNWNSTGDSQFRLMSGFRDSHVTDQLIVRSVPLLNEMTIVTQEGHSIGAEGNQKDDRVFAAGLAIETWKAWVRPEMIQLGQTFAREMKLGDDPQKSIATVLNVAVKRAVTISEDMLDRPEPKTFLEQRGLY